MKHNVWLRVSAVISVLALAVGLASPARFTAASQVNSQHVPDRPTPAFSGTAASDGFAAGLRSGPVSVVVKLSDASVAEVYANAIGTPGSAPDAAVALAQTQLAAIENAQQALLAPLANLGATVLFRNQRTYNGIAVHVDATQLDALRQLPGVTALIPLRKMTVTNGFSVPLIGAQQLWASGFTGATGSGINIGVIDTGIDYTHANFGGPGTAAAFDSNDSDTLADTGGVTLGKVLGGFDFVGDAYDGDNTPIPDPDPLDCNGHGSHVSGSAAGYGVETDGDTFAGPWDGSTDTAALRIGPGVAPEANLYALKVFGCEGGTEVVDAAVEWAMDPNGDADFSDHLDVINLSLGAPYGDVFDSSTMALDAAASVGVVVVASAGNEGEADGYYATGSPGVADRAISVASSVDAVDTFDAFLVSNSSDTGAAPNGFYPGSPSVAFDWLTDTLPITGTLVYPPSQQSGCQPFTVTNTAIIDGNIVLLDWSHTPSGANECGSVARGNNAFNAGAIGFLIAYDLPVLDIGITGDARIPGMITTQDVGVQLKAALPLSLTFSADYLGTGAGRVSNPGLIDTLSSFSSRGPRADNAAKPDIAAPGQTIWSTGIGTGDLGASNNGTSMAAPHVAGSMALLLELNPNWTVQELKALVMNTALNDIRFSPVNTTTVDVAGPLFSPSAVGAGRIDLAVAQFSEVIAYSAEHPWRVSVSEGLVEVLPGDTAAITSPIQVDNLFFSDTAYYVEYDPIVDDPAVDVTIPITMVSVGSFDSAIFGIQTVVDGNDLLVPFHDPNMLPLTAAATDRHFQREESGHITLVPVDAALNAALSGENEVPPVSSGMTGTADITYNAFSNELTVDLSVTPSGTVSVTAAHIHRGYAGINGPVAYGLYDSPGGTQITTTTTLTTAVVTLSDADERLLLSGDLYVNVHTVEDPSGAARGQILWAGDTTDTAIRVPYYINPRAISEMFAVDSTLPYTGTNSSLEIELDGDPLGDGTDPSETVALVTALELQEIDESEGVPYGWADLQHVAVGSDASANGGLAGSELFFGITTHFPWASPNQSEFDIYLDMDQDGSEDFVLFNCDTNLCSGVTDPNDEYVTVLANLNEGGLSFQDYLNYLPFSVADTRLLNTNAMILPVLWDDLGHHGSSPAFDYYVVSFTRYGFADVSDVHTFNPAAPGVDTSGGFTGIPTWTDVPGEVVPVEYNSFNFNANLSLGVLLIHHFNELPFRTQVVTIDDSTQPVITNRIFLPFIAR